MTVSSFCSLSLDPPLILVCAANQSRTLTQIRTYGVFAVNVLRHDQAETARVFADPDISQHTRFAATRYQYSAHATPVLEDAAAWLSCGVRATHPGGDHTILIGSVLALGHAQDQPLIWHSRRFHSLA
jgi:flavin reductase (DIM6/NTAB) family NADH-FMN oxidoreductase RutF